MNTLNLILAEIRFRFVNFCLCLLVVSLAATLFVMGPGLLSGYEKDMHAHLADLQSEAEKQDAEAKKQQTEAEELQQKADELKKKTEQMKQETEAMLAKMDKETKRIMRDMGVNLRIVHKDTNMANLYTDFVAVDFPEDYVHRLAQSKEIEVIVHVVATLQDKIKWNDRTVLLVGTLPVLTESQKNEEKPHMIKNVAEGTVLVGSEIGANHEEGDTIEIEGHQLTIAKIMPEYGSLQDVQLVTHLKDAQKILNRPGKINQIMALNCKCKGNRISVIRKELEGVLPDTKVTEHLTQAEAREKQRDLVEQTRQHELELVEANLQRIEENRSQLQASNERQAEARQRQAEARQRQAETRRQQQRTLTQLVAIATPVAVFGSALFVALMTWLNVRERRSEIGVLRALGKGAGQVASMFLGKAFLTGVLGGVAGCALGYWLAPLIGSRTMGISPELFQVSGALLLATLAGAPVVTMMASYLPTLAAIGQDPAIVLIDA
jgi:ABC-type lipoprotein release transport system permease subunit